MSNDTDLQAGEAKKPWPLVDGEGLDMVRTMLGNGFVYMEIERTQSDHYYDAVQARLRSISDGDIARWALGKTPVPDEIGRALLVGALVAREDFTTYHRMVRWAAGQSLAGLLSVYEADGPDQPGEGGAT